MAILADVSYDLRLDALAPGAGVAVPGHVAGILKVHNKGGNDPVESIVAAIGKKCVLLLLDNCEHVAGEVASLCMALLERCPQLTILATSRTPLCSTE